jgi:hypothetical protein
LLQLRPLAEYSAQPTISLVAAAAVELACCVEVEAEDPWMDEDEDDEVEAADPLCALCVA